MAKYKRLLISRTDAIGDVALTLPLVALIKKNSPNVELFFLAKPYTRDLVEASKNVDHYINSETLSIEELKSLNLDAILHVFPNPHIAKLAKKAKIPVRIGTRSRLYHFLDCNKLVTLKRRSSDLHEAKLNINLAVQAGILPTEVLNEDLNKIDLNLNIEPFWPKELAHTENKNQKKIILHIGSRMSARNWPIEHFLDLAHRLSKTNSLVYLTGSKAEGESFLPQFKNLINEKKAFNLTGTMNLKELMGFILNCDALVAASTGPLHLAAILDRGAIGIYPPQKPIDSGRWAPIGLKVKVLSNPNYKAPTCKACTKKSPFCACMKEVTPSMVESALHTVW